MLRAALGIASNVGWVLDRPAPPPQRTVIIIGHQRSGTTWLHRLLAAHPAASAMPLHALLLPANTWQAVLSRLFRVPGLVRLQDRLFGSLDPVHRFRLHEYEDDEYLLWALFRSLMNEFDHPWPPGLEFSIDDDGTALRFYAQSVARAVRRTGRRHVGKNNYFTHRTAALQTLLPGVRFVQLVRHPAEAIPSRLSTVRAIWRWRFPAFRDFEPHHIAAIYRKSVDCYLGGLDAADMDLAYEELIGDPLGTVEGVHRQLDLEPLDQEYRSMVSASARRAGAGHAYTLAEFGLDRDKLAEDLKPIYARWGFTP